MKEMDVFLLPAGTICHRNGIPFSLNEDTWIATHPNNWKLINEDWQPSSGGVSENSHDPL